MKSYVTQLKTQTLLLEYTTKLSSISSSTSLEKFYSVTWLVFTKVPRIINSVNTRQVNLLHSSHK